MSSSSSKRLIARSLRRVTRTAAQRRRRPQLRALVNRATAPLFKGDRVECPVCERRFDRFRAYTSGVNKNSYLMCPSCGSLGRHRLDWLFLRERTDLCHAPIRLLHDAIVCNHVLEHVDDDRLALSELFRVLKPGGWALLQVPIGRPGQATYDDPTITSDRERERLFGQFDHVRIYGSDYPERLAEAGFDVEVIAYADEFGADEVRRMGLDRGELIHWARRP